LIFQVANALESNTLATAPPKAENASAAKLFQATKIALPALKDSMVIPTVVLVIVTQMEPCNYFFKNIFLY